MADTRGRVVVVALVAGLVLTAALAVAGEGDVPGHHHDHGRFTSQPQGFPPQPVGLTDPTAVAVRSFAGHSPQDIASVAASDDGVAALLAGDAELIGVHEVATKARGPGGHAVTWFVPDRAMTVVATVVDGVVVDVEEVAAATWQPPLTADEVDRAVAIARSHWRDAGVTAVGDLGGFAMHTMDADGTYPATRMAYVTFAAHVDARPELLTWVDLTSGVVTHSRRAPVGPSPAAPSHFGQGGSGAGAPRAGELEWNGWQFSYALSGRMDGIALQEVSFEGVLILDRASMPAMTVFYEDDACGPFVDRLGGELTPVDWADGAEVVVREFTQSGQEWLELGVLDTLGEYVLYQSFYLSAEGQLDAHTFAKGLQCENDHAHYPFWRFDVDLGGSDGDQIRRATPDGPQIMESEFDLGADAAVEHGWEVVDPTSGHRVSFAFDDGSWNVPGQVVPETLYATNTIHGRQFDLEESGAWTWGAVADLPHNAGRDLEDVVLWYRGYLPHTAEEGPDLWHSTGVRLTVDLGPGHFVRPD